MTTINEIYFMDDKYSIEEVLDVLLRKNKIKTIDMVEWLVPKLQKL